MSTGGPTGQGLATTPDRKSRIRLGVSDQGLTRQPWGQIVYYDRAQQSSDAQPYNCSLVPKVGWQLTPLAYDLSAVHELTSAQAYVLKAQADGGSLQVASGVVTKFVHRKKSELQGATTGANSDLADRSDYFLYKVVTAGQDWRQVNLSADQANFPDISTETTFHKFFSSDLQLSRLVVDTVPHNGRKPFMFRFTVPAARTDLSDILFIVYFCGPASLDVHSRGFGRYALVIKGDGSFVLYEMAQNLNDLNEIKWALKLNGQRYAPAGQVAGTHHRIMVFPYTERSPRAGRAGGIAFLCTVGDSLQTDVASTAGLFKHNPKAGVIHYACPHKAGQNTPKTTTLPAPLRLSQRVDLRLDFQFSYIGLKNTGRFVCSPVVFPTTVAASSDITVGWFGDLPANTSIGAQIFDAGYRVDGDPSNPDANGNTPYASSLLVSQGTVWGGTFTFRPSTYNGLPSSTYNLRVVLSSSSPASATLATPTVSQIRWVVNGGTSSTGDQEFSVEYPSNHSTVRISGPEADPSHETAAVQVNDLGGFYNRLNTRGHFAVKVDTEYSGMPANGHSVLFDGYAIQSPAERKGSAMPAALGSSTVASFPASSWRSYNVTCVGKWQRLHATVAPFNWDFAIDPSAPVIGTPPFAVDVIQLLLGWAGFPEAMIDIGPNSSSSSSNYPIRLWPRGPDEGIVLRAGANLAEFIQGLARDYLGAAFVWDANATKASLYSGDLTTVQGCWRLIHPALAPFRNLAAFVTTGPDRGSAAVVHSLASYTVGVGVGGQPIAQVPIFKSTLKTFVSPPERNKVVVTGTGEISNSEGTQAAMQLTCFAVNVSSYNFNGLATANPDSPDFIGYEEPGYKVDTMAITTPEAARWVLRRYYDLTCHAYKHVTFTAPLVLVTNTSDTAQKKPRPLRFYDPVTVDGEQFLVRSCSPFFDKDDHQLATYELMSVPPAYTIPELPE